MQSVQVKFWDGLQGIQGIQEASGTPSSVGLQGLQSFTAYRCQAVWLDNNTPFAESNISAFTTLAAGSITLQLHNITRQGYDYVVHYLVTSTYALSNAVLSINGGQIFQGVIQGNTITFTVSGLDAGTSYLYQVQAEDIYQESVTVTGTLVTTVVNEVNMYYNSRSENSVTFDLSYIHDYVFRGGWVNVWNSTQDPTQDNPITYEMWDDGDTQITIPSLSPETTYYFQAGMTVEDVFGSQTTVYSSVVTATTADHDYSNDYFTIKNEYNGENTVKLYYLNNQASNRASVEYSIDGGTTWRSKSASNSGATITTLAAGESVMIRRSFNQAQNFSRITFNCTQPYSAMGNMASLLVGSFYLDNTYNLQDYWFEGLFHSGSYYGIYTANDVGTQNLIDASRLYFGNFTSSVPKYAMYAMFVGCGSLVKAPDLRWVKSVDEYGLTFIFAGCGRLTSVFAPTIDFSNTPTAATGSWLKNVAASGTLYADRTIASTIPTDSIDGCPTGWRVQTI